jgi:hypothetical protein
VKGNKTRKGIEGSSKSGENEIKKGEKLEFFEDIRAQVSNSINFEIPICYLDI